VTAWWIFDGVLFVIAAVLGAVLWRRRQQDRAEWLADLENGTPDRHWDDVRKQLRPPPPVWPPQITDQPSRGGPE
jgi:hypothetical protein